jgi:hypothetical protein
MEMSTYESTLFPAPAEEVKFVSQSHMEIMGVRRVEITDASHESIIRNLDRNTSTARTFHHESTMLPFRCDEIHEQCCDSSTDLVERATFECFFAFPHLRRNIRLLASLVNNGTLEG